MVEILIDKMIENKKAAAIGFCIRRADVQTRSFVLLLNFKDKLKLCALIPNLTQSQEPLCNLLKNLYEVINSHTSNFLNRL